MMPPKDEPLWSDVAFRMFVNIASHPIEYAKVLIQIGYEPIAPRPTTTFLRQPALIYPNVFQYVKYIKNVDGFSGCYRGLVPKLCAYSVCAVACDKTSKSIDKYHNDKKRQEEEDTQEDGERIERCTYELIRDLISRMVGIIVSHPLDVITFRIMAQFVGREQKYNGLFRSLVEVYKENGIMGYYAGLMPRLIANAAVIILVSSSTYAINKYIITDREIKAYTASTMRFLATTITYPFLVVSHCMAVNDCGLAAGLPPRMPIYNSWTDCWSQLSAAKQLARGSSLLFRYYTGPQVVINGKAVAISEEDFYSGKKSK